MKFTIDIRYTIILTLKVIAGYVIGNLLGIILFDSKDPLDLLMPTFFAALFVYFLFFFPRRIIVKDNVVYFVEKYGYERIGIHLNDIIKTEQNVKYYNTLTIYTKSDRIYKLHPKDIDKLNNILSARDL